jgi:glycine/D-amino acid oxidase-like deaminating enzyme
LQPQRAKGWGEPPWVISFRPELRRLPDAVDFAIVGAGFTGLSAAAWLARQAPHSKIAVFEGETIGSGSSGHTGGLALAETAAGDLPGLGDVLGGLSSILSSLHIEPDLSLPGAWEIGRSGGKRDSPIVWSDSGELRMTEEVPGGYLDAGELLSGLARSASHDGVLIFEGTGVGEIAFGKQLLLYVRGKQIAAEHILIATNAQSLELGGMSPRAVPKFTLALATGSLTDRQLQSLGMASGKPFYTRDLPYLWGRPYRGNRLIFGSGLVHLNDWRQLLTLDISSGEAAKLMKDLQDRVRSLHPALSDALITHRWGGPILIADDWQPIFTRHPRDHRILVLGAYSGHGVALSVYLGSWAADVMLQRRELPNWNSD